MLIKAKEVNMKRIINNPEWMERLQKLEHDSSHWNVFFNKAIQKIQASSFEESNALSRDKDFFKGMPHFKKTSCLLSMLCDFIFFIQKLYSITHESKGHLTQQTDLKHVIYFIILTILYHTIPYCTAL